MNIGQKVLFELKKEISEIEYERYIKNLVYDTKRSRSNIVYFNAPNMIVAKWIKSKYTDKLMHLFELQNEIKPEIEITVGKQNTTKSRHSVTNIIQVKKVILKVPILTLL